MKFSEDGQTGKLFKNNAPSNFLTYDKLYYLK